MRTSIINKLIQLAEEFLPDDSIKNPEERLHVIGSESIRAIEFITAVEDEFEIEIDDDDIGGEFFVSYEFINDAIIRSQNRN